MCRASSLKTSIEDVTDSFAFLLRIDDAGQRLQKAFASIDDVQNRR